MDWDAVKRRRMARDAEEAENRGVFEPSADWSWPSRKDFRPRRPSDGGRRRRSPADGPSWGGLAWQILGAAVLVGGVYTAFHQEGALSDRVKAVAEKALTEQTHWSDVVGWVQEVAGDGLALPVVESGSNPIWSAPLSGTIVQDYSQQRPWVVFDGVPGAVVTAAGKGVVEQVDRRDDYGLYVVVNHGAKGKTLYGSLGDVQVKKGDYVYPGQAIGHLTGQRPARLLFGYIVDGRYADPHTVLDGKGR